MHGVVLPSGQPFARRPAAGTGSWRMETWCGGNRVFRRTRQGEAVAARHRSASVFGKAGSLRYGYSRPMPLRKIPSGVVEQAYSLRRISSGSAAGYSPLQVQSVIRRRAPASRRLISRPVSRKGGGRLATPSRRWRASSAAPARGMRGAQPRQIGRLGAAA